MRSERDHEYIIVDTLKKINQHINLETNVIFQEFDMLRP